tara:strand:+ start:270 stop:374 length:105 start_codon:yes stop_codon:yes gene_type:complete
MKIIKDLNLITILASIIAIAGAILVVYNIYIILA